MLVGGPRCCLGHEVNWLFDEELKAIDDRGHTESVVWPKPPWLSCVDSVPLRPLDQHGQTYVHELQPFG